MAIDWTRPLSDSLDAAEPRPEPNGSREDKKNYAERLSRELAVLVAESLRTRKEFRGITPSTAGEGHEIPTAAEGGRKRLDVRLMNPEVGLVLNVSIKTYSFQDYSPKSGKLGRYTKNIVRNDHELRAEADVIHRRQPYAVLVAVVFMNARSAFDADKQHSSFAHAVFTFRKRTGRSGPHDPRTDRFEKVFIALYEPDGPARGECSFFDVENPPPRNGLPSATLDLRSFVEETAALVATRTDTDFIYEDGDHLAVPAEELSLLSLLSESDEEGENT